MDRRSFFKWFGVGVGAAPAVKAVVTMPDASVVDVARWDGVKPQRFIDGQPIIQGRQNWWDVQDALLYDRIIFRPGEVLPMHLPFFQVSLGQPCPYTGRVKTLRHTNMWTGGQLSAPRQFFAQRALFAVHPRTQDSDLEALSELGVWEFRLMQKIMWRGPMMMHGPGKAGLRDVVKDFPESRAQQFATAQNPLPDQVTDTAHHSPLTGGTFIPSLCYFCLTVEFPDQRVRLSETGNGLDLLIAFQGADARGVQ